MKPMNMKPELDIIMLTFAADILSVMLLIRGVDCVKDETIVDIDLCKDVLTELVSNFTSAISFTM